jgi:cell division transport system permease protein
MLPGLGYGLARGLRGLRRRPTLTAWSTIAVAAALLAFALVHLAARNVTAWTRSWGGGASMVVYLEAGTDEAQAQALGAELAGIDGVEHVDYVAPAAAASRLRAALGGHDELLDGVDDDALPASLEITLAPGLRDVAAAHPVVDALRGAPGVEDVEIVGPWVEQVDAVLAALDGAAWALLAVLGAVAIWVTAASVRVRLQGLAEEARVASLLGASGGFIRGPVLLQGLVQGLVGGVLAILGLLAVYRLAMPGLSAALGEAFGALEVSFLPADNVLAVIAAGAGLGLVGGWLASGRRALETT